MVSASLRGARIERSLIEGLLSRLHQNPVVRSRLSILFLTVFMDLLGFGLVNPDPAHLRHAAGCKLLQVGLIMAVYALMNFVFCPFWGTMSDRHGRRPVIAVTVLHHRHGLSLAGQRAQSRLALRCAHAGRYRFGQHRRVTGLHHGRYTAGKPRKGLGHDRCGIRSGLHLRSAGGWLHQGALWHGRCGLHRYGAQSLQPGTHLPLPSGIA